MAGMTDEPKPFFTRQRWLTLAALAVIVPFGFGMKFYRGPGDAWVNHSLGGAAYEIFWCLAALFCLPRAAPARIALGVFLATCALEFLQLWHPPFLETLRANFLARTVLGSTFSWSDFPYYALGSLLGWKLLGWLGPATKKDPEES